MARTMAVSRSMALCVLAERSARTMTDCSGGEVWNSKPASAPVRSRTMRTRRPSDIRARHGGRGGARRHQTKTTAASAIAPAPRKRGRVSSKPTVEGEPFGEEHDEGDEGDPG